MSKNRAQKKSKTHACALDLKIGATGFELATSCTPCKRATRLRYAPIIGLASEIGATGFELATSCTPCKRATRLRYAPSTDGRRIDEGAHFVKIYFHTPANFSQKMTRTRANRSRCRGYFVVVAAAGLCWRSSGINRVFLIVAPLSCLYVFMASFAPIESPIVMRACERIL